MNATSIILDKYMFKRPGSAMWQLRKHVPEDVKAAFGRPVVSESLRTSNDRDATKVAMARLEELDEQWASIRLGNLPSLIDLDLGVSGPNEPPRDTKNAIIRAVYERVAGEVEARDHARFLDDRVAHLSSAQERRASARELIREVRTGNVQRFVGPTEQMLTNRGVNVDREAPWFQDLVRDVATAVLDARDVGLRVDEGELSPEPTTDVVKRALGSDGSKPAAKNLPFAELAEEFMKQWVAGRSNDKKTNTEQQKRATFSLFAGFFEDKPIRTVRNEDAAAFFDTVRLLDPNWARSPSARQLPWSKLIERFGGRSRGLADGTMNRHLQVLQELWLWSKKRGHCEGDNPFDGFRKKLRPGVNVKGYLAWEDEELRRLFNPPPKRSDVREVILVGMFTGMRLDEVASLTWGNVRKSTEGGVITHYFQVEDAKTPAGNRMVPVHPALSWLLSRKRGAPADRLWPTFNDEGPGKKPGNDAGREFSTFKIAKGFTDETKTFHSFRKNVTRMMERGGVPENDWAQIFGHERGFTYGRYNADGITMVRRAEIIALISYSGVDLPLPAG